MCVCVFVVVCVFVLFRARIAYDATLVAKVARPSSPPAGGEKRFGGVVHRLNARRVVPRHPGPAAFFGRQRG